MHILWECSLFGMESSLSEYALDSYYRVSLSSCPWGRQFFFLVGSLHPLGHHVRAVVIGDAIKGTFYMNAVSSLKL